MSAPKTALKNCPHDGSEHRKNINGYWVCAACARERARDRRAGGPGRGANNSGKTHCPRKHKYTTENTIVRIKPNGKKQRWCRACQRIHMRKVVITQYGITIEQFDAMLIAQAGRCAVCPVLLYVPQIDHDHDCCPGRKACGKCVRGLVCADCNTGLGKFRDSIVVLRSAVDYLERHASKI